MKKQTAIDWLINELKEQNLIKLDKNKTVLFSKNFATRYELIIHEAKEIEKNQIMDAYGDEKSHLQDDGSWKRTTAEQYYNETYGE